MRLIGIITQATFKIHDVPETEDYRGYLFRSFAEGADAIRQIVQAEIPTAMLRLSDPDETYFFRTLSSVGKEKGIKDNLADAYLRLPKSAEYVEKIWDHAAGALVVQEAGGRVSDIHGRDLDFSRGYLLSGNRGVIVSNGRLHDAVLEAIAALGIGD